MTGISSATFIVRRADRADALAIADAHRDSIESLGPRGYAAEVVAAWSASVDPVMYSVAMACGEHFFVAIDRRERVLGFSSHRADEGVHGVAVYVRGDASRIGVGSALLRAAEVAAVADGARELRIEASLAAVDFYHAHGFETVGRGEHRLRSGTAMACVCMRKDLS
jgi:ribosomal protein S18 acetylase RimI-like enzyme